MKFITPILQFLKKHYEKIILCVVLLGMAAAAVWMGSVIKQVKEQVDVAPQAPHGGKPIPPLDLTADQLALAAVTNPPPLVLSGDHNLFNPVTWKRKPNGDLLKILRTGPDALAILNINPLYTVISYDHPTGTAGIYVFNVQTNSGRKTIEHPRINEKTKLGLYIIRGIKGAPEDPTDLALEIPETGETNWISKGKPYQRVDGYTVDMRYDPESKTLLKMHDNEMMTLDGEPYKIVEITNNAVRVQTVKNTKVTRITWNGVPETSAPAPATTIKRNENP